MFSRYIKIAAICGITALSAGAAQAVTVNVNFQSDTNGFKPNGFVSNGSSVVSFSDTMVSPPNSGLDGLRLRRYSGESQNRSLAVYGNDESRLQMDFTGAVSNLSLAFGNDDPADTEPGFLAVMMGFFGGSLVETVTVVLNRDDYMNQRISLGAGLIDQAFFFYSDADMNAIGLREVVDRIAFDLSSQSVPSPIPLPAALPLLLSAFGGLALFRRRRNKAA
jgi:hypothetical protein